MAIIGGIPHFQTYPIRDDWNLSRGTSRAMSAMTLLWTIGILLCCPATRQLAMGKWTCKKMTCISSVLKSIHSRPPRLNRQFLQQLLHHIASCCVGILHTGRIYEDNMGMHMGSCCRANDAHLAKVDVCQFEILYFPKRAGIATSNWFPKLFTPTKSRHWLLLMFTSCLSTWIPHFFSDLSCHVMPCHAMSCHFRPSWPAEKRQAANPSRESRCNPPPPVPRSPHRHFRTSAPANLANWRNFGIGQNSESIDNL